VIDGIGAGYSSLRKLKRFPVDSIKINRCFGRDVTSDPGGGRGIV
jgi:EAL domain-containing protein (putative c-di-GMP-specific phosphodiesterase class I)